MYKACCGFGHREVFSNISGQLDKALLEAAEKGCKIFYTGAMGEFDNLFSSAVRNAKKTYPNIKLICVKPYFTNDINTGRDYYNAMYDDVIIPPEIIGVHYKAAINERNRRIIDNCNVVLVYIIRDYGGAFDAMKYALKRKKYVIKV